MSQVKKVAALPAMRRVAVAVFVLAALLSGTSGPLAAGIAARVNCRCPVPMSCCHSDMCTMGEHPGNGPSLSSCESPSREGLPVPALILAIVPSGFVPATSSNWSSAALLAVVRPADSPLSSDSPPPRSLLFS